MKFVHQLCVLSCLMISSSLFAQTTSGITAAPSSSPSAMVAPSTSGGASISAPSTATMPPAPTNSTAVPTSPNSIPTNVVPPNSMPNQISAPSSMPSQISAPNSMPRQIGAPVSNNAAPSNVGVPNEGIRSVIPASSPVTGAASAPFNNTNVTNQNHDATTNNTNNLVKPKSLDNGLNATQGLSQ